MVINYQDRRRPLVALLVFTLFLTLALYPQTALANAVTETEMRSISGMVYLPDGDTAPAGGMRVRVLAYGFNGTADSSDDYFGAVNVIIPEGYNSIGYSITVPDNMSGGYIVRYIIDSCQKYLRTGFYNESGTAWNFIEAEDVLISGSDVEGIDLSILTGVKISGVIEIEDGQIAPAGGVQFYVVAQSIYPDSSIFSIAEFLISEGSNSAAYSLAVPSEIAAQYIVSYLCSSAYGVEGYYAQAGTVLNREAASPVDVNGNDVQGINMTLIMKTFVMSGTISLPEGVTAPIGGIEGYVLIQGENEALNNPAGYYTDHSIWNIPEGENSTIYSIEIPDSVTKGVRVYCSPDGKHGYVGGYYSESGLTRDYWSASLAAAGGVDTEGIDFVLDRGLKISGTISLPEGEMLPSDDVSFIVYALSDNGTPDYFIDDNYVQGSALIKAGETSSGFAFTIPPEMSGKVKIAYEEPWNSIYVTGYYNTDGTVWNRDAATPLDISGGDVTDININVLKGKTITGTVSLPDGETAPANGIKLYTIVDGDNGTPDNQLDDYVNYNTTYGIMMQYIPEGENSVSYTVKIPCDLAEGVKIGYGVFSIDYCDGFYGINGTTWNYENAASIIVSDSGIADINMTILEGRTISGCIFLPDGQVVNGGDMPISILFYSDNGTPEDLNDDFYLMYQNQINEGSSHLAYNVTVPEIPAGFIVSCFSEPGSSYGGGFYNENGTLTDWESATRIYVAGSDVSGIDMVLLDPTSEENPSLVVSNNLPGSIAAGTLVQASKEIVITVGASAIENLKGFDLQFSYDPALFELLEVKAHEEFGAESDNVYLDYVDNGGNIRIVGAILGTGDRSGETDLVNIKLKAKTKVDGKTSAVVKAQSQIADSFEKLYTFENDIFSSIVIADPDVDGDGQIGEGDLEKAAESFMDEEGQEGYIAKRDMDKDGIVDLFDIVYVARILLHNTN